MDDRKSLKRKKDWEGRIVRTCCVLRSGMNEIPTGTLMRVTYNRSGLHLETKPCQCCGVKVFIRGVSESDVELLPVGDYGY